MITARGWEAVTAAVVALFLGLYSLNPVLELVGVAVFGFVVVEMLWFETAFRDLSVGRFRVERSAGPRRLPSDGELATSVSITLLDGPGFAAEVYDVVPDAFDITSGRTRTRTWLAPGAVLRLSYSVRPRVRGAYVQGPTIVVARDAFGLCYRATALETQRPLIIVPPSLAGRLGRLGLALLSRVQAGLSMRRRGFGSEFRALRPYQSSDDIRHVAWKRSTPEQLVVREFDQESRQEFLLVLDLSTAMDAGRWGRNALDASVEASALLANLIAHQGEDRIGLLTYAGGVYQYLAPGRGPHHLRRLVDNLALAAHRPGDCPLPDLLQKVTERLSLRSHVFVFTAVDGSLVGLDRAHANLRAHGHRPYVFIPRRGAFYPRDPSGGSTSAFAWAQGEEQRRSEGALAAVQAEGIPVFPFDARGAGDRVLYAYSQIRAWGTVR